MNQTTLAVALIVVLGGAGAGVLGAILGIGGGVILIPILVLGIGVPIHQAVGTSLVAVVATSSAVASTNVERGTANMRLGMVLEIATTLGAIAGGLTAAWLSASVLETIFAVVLFPTAIFMWRGQADKRGAENREASEPTPTPTDPVSAQSQEALGALGASYPDKAEGREVAYRVRRVPAGLGISLVAGNLSGLLGIGGGVFKVPALHLLCDIPIKAAAATSNFMIGVTASASAFLYYGRGDVRPVLTAAAVLGVLAGSALGSAVNRYIGGAVIRRLFAILLIAVAGQMLYRAWIQGI